MTRVVAPAFAMLVCATGCRAIFGLDDPGSGGDAAVDADPLRLCWGSEFQVCLPSPPSQAEPKTLTGAIDTSTSSLCEPSIAAWCVIAASTINIGAADITGARPVILIGADSIAIDDRLDIASHVGRPGPAAMGASCNAFAAAPTQARGGGAGGTLAGVGGSGGTASNGAVGGEPAPIVALSGLHAGCPGQDGGGAVTHMGFGGLGGGAAYLIAGREIELRTGSRIDASGAGGGGALCTGDCANSMGESGGGGGGGSGGMLILEAPAITSGGTIFADGGGGGEGASGSNSGLRGADPDGTKSASGGMGGANNGGDGGGGSYAAVASGGAGTRGESSLQPPGGGGGGGGAGAIRVYGTARIEGGTVSPPPEVR